MKDYTNTRAIILLLAALAAPLAAAPSPPPQIIQAHAAAKARASKDKTPVLKDEAVISKDKAAPPTYEASAPTDKAAPPTDKSPIYNDKSSPRIDKYSLRIDDLSAPVDESSLQIDKPPMFVLQVGIGKYLDFKRLPNLRGARPDVERMRAVLTGGRYNVPAQNIRTLIDEEATKQRIFDEFENFLVASAREYNLKTKRRDAVVMFEFSGHGSQAPDAAPFDEADGKDETFVTYASFDEPGKNFDITDDEIYELTRRLRKYTDDIVYVLDSCHSGSATRASGDARRVTAGRYAPVALLETDATRGAAGKTEKDEPQTDLLPAGDDYIVISAAQADELAGQKYIFETEQTKTPIVYGNLTYYLTEQLTEARADTSYRELMDAVRRKVAAETDNTQIPQIEGDAKRFVFGGTGARADNYTRIAAVDKNTFTIAAGAAQGVEIGTIVAVYDNKRTRFDGDAGKIAVGKVTTVAADKAVVRIVSRSSQTTNKSGATKEQTDAPKDDSGASEIKSGAERNKVEAAKDKTDLIKDKTDTLKDKVSAVKDKVDAVKDKAAVVKDERAALTDERAVTTDDRAVILSPDFGAPRLRFLADGEAASKLSDADKLLVKSVREKFVSNDGAANERVVVPAIGKLNDAAAARWDAALLKDAYGKVFPENGGAPADKAANASKQAAPSADTPVFYLANRNFEPLYNFFVRADDENAAAKIENAVVHLAHQRAVRAVSNDKSALKGLVTIVPFRFKPAATPCGADGRIQIAARSYAVFDPRKNAYPFEQGEYFGLEIVNRSKRDLYIALLDIGGDGSVSLRAPEKIAGEQDTGVKLAPGEKKIVSGEFCRSDVFVTGAPAGVETFKIFATTFPTKRSDYERFEIDAVKRGAGKSLAAPTDWTTAEANLEIAPAKDKP